MDKEDWGKLCEGELRNTKLPVMLYCHGNSNNRATSHRIQLYKFFQKMDFHTIAFDYRGYGDSTNVSPSEEGVVEDALMMYQWLTDVARRAPVFVWGHSLGTGISSHLLGNLSQLSLSALGRELPMPSGLFLEAPFNNLADEVAKHPLSKLVTWLPYYESSFVSPFRSPAGGTPAGGSPAGGSPAGGSPAGGSPAGASFRSDEHLRRAPALPALLLHACDDRVVPHAQGKKLFESIVESRVGGGAPVIFHSYHSSLHLGHKWICLAEDLPHVVRDFVKAHAHK